MNVDENVILAGEKKNDKPTKKSASPGPSSGKP
jgi:hypothetical protein